MDEFILCFFFFFGGGMETDSDLGCYADAHAVRFSSGVTMQMSFASLGRLGSPMCRIMRRF